MIHKITYLLGKGLCKYLKSKKETTFLDSLLFIQRLFQFYIKNIITVICFLLEGNHTNGHFVRI